MICENWNSITNDYVSLIGKSYVNDKGEVWEFLGLLHAEDDYYYLMYREDKYMHLSCAGDIVSFGFELIK